MATVEELDAAVEKLKAALVARAGAAADKAQADNAAAKAASEAASASAAYDEAKAQASGATEVLVATAKALDAGK